MLDERPRPVEQLSSRSVTAHGLDVRGQEAGALPGGGTGRFGRMFQFRGPPLPDDCLRDIAESMIQRGDTGAPIDESEPVDENPCIPAGYTYFAQFVDHDITLDATPLHDSSVDVAALENFRTPALDLDCVYGRGPDDQPYMYREEDGSLLLRTGESATSAGAPVGTRDHLLRLALDGATKHPALIGDKRNDENRLVSQLQAVFIAFHNKVVQDQDLVEAGGGVWSDQVSRFRGAVNIVRWHYQWLVLHDFLDRVLLPGVLEDVLNPGGVPRIQHYEYPRPRWGYIPVEFAGAAYRFGHSMVRPSYALNANIGSDTGEGTNRIPIFSRNGPTDNLNGFGIALPPDWGIDWSFFLDGLDTAHLQGISDENGDAKAFHVPQPSYRLDATLVEPLSDLPEFRDQMSPFASLAYRNLKRGVTNLCLPSGEQVAHAIGIEPLGPDVLWSAGSSQLDEGALSDDEKEDLEATEDRRAAVRADWVDGDDPVLRGNTPLWYYILREAEFFGVERKPDDPAIGFGGQHLGPVGSQIVAETFVGLLWNDPLSMLIRWPNFEPLIPTRVPGEFKLSDLVAYALS